MMLKWINNLWYSILNLFRGHKMSDDQVPAATDTVETPVVTSAPEPAVAETPSRPLDQIHQELVAAQAAHAAAVKAVADSTGVVATLRGEYHAALTWFQEEEKSLLADFDTIVSDGESWVVKALKAL